MLIPVWMQDHWDVCVCLPHPAYTCIAYRSIASVCTPVSPSPSPLQPAVGGSHSLLAGQAVCTAKRLHWPQIGHHCVQRPHWGKALQCTSLPTACCRAQRPTMSQCSLFYVIAVPPWGREGGKGGRQMIKRSSHSSVCVCGANVCALMLEW